MSHRPVAPFTSVASQGLQQVTTRSLQYEFFRFDAAEHNDWDGFLDSLNKYIEHQNGIIGSQTIDLKSENVTVLRMDYRAHTFKTDGAVIEYLQQRIEIIRMAKVDEASGNLVPDLPLGPVQWGRDYV